jgi:hypothetical protein
VSRRCAPSLEFFDSHVVSRPLTSYFYSRFGGSSLHQRDPRSALFENYNGGANDKTRAGSSSPNRQGGYGGGYGYSGGPNGSAGFGGGLGAERPGYRPATPNSRYVVIKGGDRQVWVDG